MITKLMESILPFGEPIEAKVFVLNDIRDDVLTTLYKKSYGNKKGYELFLEHVSLYDKTEIDGLQYNYRIFQPYVDVLLENKIKFSKTYVYPELKLYTEYKIFEDYDAGYATVNINYNKIYADILIKMFNDDLYEGQRNEVDLIPIVYEVKLDYSSIWSNNELLIYKNIYKRVKEIEEHESMKHNETVDDILEMNKIYNPFYF